MDERKPSLTAAEKEARRKLAIRKVLDGRTQADVADFLGVHAVTVAKWMKAYRDGGETGRRRPTHPRRPCKWMKAYRDGGETALAAKPVPGRPRFLTAGQEAEVRDWLLKTPTAFGFRTDLWTAARVAQLIRDKLGVAFHPNYLREWLTRRGYSPQKPVRRPKQRNPQVIDAGLGQAYPALQKKSRPTKPTSC